MASLTDAVAEDGARDLATWEEDVQENGSLPSSPGGEGRRLGEIFPVYSARSPTS